MGVLGVGRSDERRLGRLCAPGDRWGRLGGGRELVTAGSHAEWDSVFRTHALCGVGLVLTSVYGCRLAVCGRCLRLALCVERVYTPVTEGVNLRGARLLGPWGARGCTSCCLDLRRCWGCVFGAERTDRVAGRGARGRGCSSVWL